MATTPLVALLLIHPRHHHHHRPNHHHHHDRQSSWSAKLSSGKSKDIQYLYRLSYRRSLFKNQLLLYMSELTKVILFALSLLCKLEERLWACLACVEGKSMKCFTIHVYFSDSLKYVFLWFFNLYFSDICEQVCERVWPALKENQWSVLLSESQTLPLTLA